MYFALPRYTNSSTNVQFARTIRLQLKFSCPSASIAGSVYVLYKVLTSCQSSAIAGDESKELQDAQATSASHIEATLELVGSPRTLACDSGTSNDLWRWCRWVVWLPRRLDSGDISVVDENDEIALQSPFASVHDQCCFTRWDTSLWSLFERGTLAAIISTSHDVVLARFLVSYAEH